MQRVSKTGAYTPTESYLHLSRLFYWAGWTRVELEGTKKRPWRNPNGVIYDGIGHFDALDDTYVTTQVFEAPLRNRSGELTIIINEAGVTAVLEDGWMRTTTTYPRAVYAAACYLAGEDPILLDDEEAHNGSQE